MLTKFVYGVGNEFTFVYFLAQFTKTSYYELIIKKFLFFYHQNECKII